MYYYMKLINETKDKITYAYGPTLEELDGILEFDKETMEPVIVEKSKKIFMRFSTLHKLIISLAKGEIPETYCFAS